MIAPRTTRRTRATAAERMRAHRAAMAVALELGITPKEAEAVIASRIARQAPYSGFMPDDGLEPGIILSRDNPARPASPAAGEA